MFAGIDSHKATLAVAVVDGTGVQLAGEVFANDPAGHRRLVAFLSAAGAVRVGVEGSGGYGRTGSAALVAAGLDVREVPASMTFRERSRKPNRGKSDPIDARAIARIVAREPDLPGAHCAEGPTEDLRLLTSYRKGLTRERTRVMNQVHADLMILRPGYQQGLPQLTRPAHVRAARMLLRGNHGVRAEITRARLDRLKAIDGQLKELKAQIGELVTATGSSLLEIPGCGVLTAGRILGQTGDVRRFRDRNAYAAGNGTAPIPASSGTTIRHRLNRAGNRHLNEALHTIAIVQLRGFGPGRAYVAKQRAAGHSNREAMRSLKRRLSDVIYRTLVADLERGPTGLTAI